LTSLRMSYSSYGYYHRRQLILPLPAAKVVSAHTYCSTSACLTTALPEIGDGVLSSALFQEYQPIFINVESWDGFQESDIELNKLRLKGDPPDFVVEFRQKLDSKPALSPDVPEWFRSSLSLPPDRDLNVRYFLYLPVCVLFLMVSVGG
jgi:hypothetical protein